MDGVDSLNLEALLRQRESLRDVIESISGELALEPLLTRIVESAVTLLAADDGAIGLVVDRAGAPAVRTAAVCNMPPAELGAEMPPGVGLAGHVLREQRPVCLDRYGDLDQPTLPELAEHAVIGVPIWWAGRMIGFFGLGAEPPRRFDERDVETLSLFSRHAAIAIENARLFEAERRRALRIEVINRVGQLITSSLSLSQLLETAIQAIAQHLHYSNVALFLIESDQPHRLVLRARSGIYADRGLNEYRQSVWSGIIGAAARTRQPILVNDVRSDPRYLPLPGGTSIVAELSLPLTVGERLLGVLNIESEHPISDDDASDFAIVADQLAVAIDNARLFAEMQRVVDETHLLFETSRRISTAMDVDDVIGAYLEQVAARGQYACSVILYQFDAVGEREAVLVRGRWTAAEGAQLFTQRVAYTRDALDPVLDTGQTVTIADVHTDPRVTEALRELQRESGRPALAMIPLMVRGQRMGLVVLSAPSVHQWVESELRPYQATAAQLATAIDSRLQQSVFYARGQQLAVLEERHRLARELHDSVTQLLFSMTLIAQSIGPAWRRDPTEGERRVSRLLELSQSALAEMRALLAELRPAGNGDEAATPSLARVQAQGLAAAIRKYAADIARDGLQVDLVANAYTRQSLPREEALYRIAQEALNNVVKHAGARRVEIELTADAQAVRLRVRDDGGGFTSATPAAVDSMRPSGLGLRTMRERAEAVGGRVTVTAAPGRGTTVDVMIPSEDGTDDNGHATYSHRR
jgi:signal transduction histidine kinase